MTGWNLESDWHFTEMLTFEIWLTHQLNAEVYNMTDTSMTGCHFLNDWHFNDKLIFLNNWQSAICVDICTEPKVYCTIKV